MNYMLKFPKRNLLNILLEDKNLFHLFCTSSNKGKVKWKDSQFRSTMVLNAHAKPMTQKSIITLL